MSIESCPCCANKVIVNPKTLHLSPLCKDTKVAQEKKCAKKFYGVNYGVKQAPTDIDRMIIIKNYLNNWKGTSVIEVAKERGLTPQQVRGVFAHAHKNFGGKVFVNRCLKKGRYASRRLSTGVFIG